MFLLLCLLCGGMMIDGCQQSFSEKERGAIAQAYAEMMIAKNMAQGDSNTVIRYVDSVLRLHGFRNEQALMQEVKKLTGNPDQFREVLDSTQRILEQAQTPPVGTMLSQ